MKGMKIVEMKNSTKLIKYVAIIICILFFLILAFFAKKIIVFNNIARKIDNYLQADNYYIRTYNYEGEIYTKVETWVKEKNMILKYDNEVNKIIKDGIEYSIMADNQYMEENTNQEIKSPDFEFIEILKEELNSIKSVFYFSLNSATVNGKDCYKLQHKDTVIYFEKITGLLVRYETVVYGSTLENDFQNTVTDYKFEFDSVTDKDLEFDISSFKKILT